MNNDLKMKLLIITYLDKYRARRADDMKLHKVAKNDNGEISAKNDVDTLNEIMDYLAE